MSALAIWHQLTTTAIVKTGEGMLRFRRAGMKPVKGGGWKPARRSKRSPAPVMGAMQQYFLQNFVEAIRAFLPVAADVKILLSGE